MQSPFDGLFPVVLLYKQSSELEFDKCFFRIELGNRQCSQILFVMISANGISRNTVE